MIVAALTTNDNPYDPFEDFPSWYAFDVRHGYRTTEFVGRLTFTSDELSDTDQNEENTRVIDEIVKENISGIYRKVTKEYPDDYSVPLES